MNLVVRDPADVRSVVGEVSVMAPGATAAMAIAEQIESELSLSLSTGR
jgi:hypothetical protein